MSLHHFIKSHLLLIVVNSISAYESSFTSYKFLYLSCLLSMMLNRNVFSYFRSALSYRQVLLHKYRCHHSCISVKQALETVPSGSIPVLIQVGIAAVAAGGISDALCFIYAFGTLHISPVLVVGLQKLLVGCKIPRMNRDYRC